MEIEPISRRSFLRTIAIGTGTAIVTASFPASILAANDPSLGAQVLEPLPPHYAAGILVARSKDKMTLAISNALPQQLDVLLTPETQICRGSCNEAWNALKKGDRIATATFLGSNGSRV